MWKSTPLPNQEAETVAQMPTQEVRVPLKLHSDQGMQFESKLFQEIVELLGNHKTCTTLSDPRVTGKVRGILEPSLK